MLGGLNPCVLPDVSIAGLPPVILVIVTFSTSVSKSLNATTSEIFASDSCLLICITAFSNVDEFAKSISTTVFAVVV